MDALPHADPAVLSAGCAIVTVSDSRHPDSDRSGQLLQELLLNAGHQILAYRLVKDEPAQIGAELEDLCQNPLVEVIVFTGGTGIAPRDQTYETIAPRLQKALPGFGELFRWLSYQEIGSRAIASRAIAGVINQKLVFCLPGSPPAVRLATQELLLPELGHLLRLLT
jgi:molybdopterin adenylyltransferase